MYLVGFLDFSSLLPNFDTFLHPYLVNNLGWIFRYFFQKYGEKNLRYFFQDFFISDDGKGQFKKMGKNLPEFSIPMMYRNNFGFCGSFFF